MAFLDNEEGLWDLDDIDKHYPGAVDVLLNEELLWLSRDEFGEGDLDFSDDTGVLCVYHDEWNKMRSLASRGEVTHVLPKAGLYWDPTNKCWNRW